MRFFIIICLFQTQPFNPNSLQVTYDRPLELLGGYQHLAQQPVYPESARRYSAKGAGTATAFIDGKGMVQVVKIEKGIRKDLDEAASQAVVQSRFKPAVLLGKPVKSRLTIPVRFKFY